jgi:hypothetical protein
MFENRFVSAGNETFFETFSFIIITEETIGFRKKRHFDEVYMRLFD